MVHRNPEPVSRQLRAITGVVLAYGLVVLVIAGALTGNRFLIAAGSVPACLLAAAWATRNYRGGTMDETERLIREAVDRLEGRGLPVRGFGGEIIPGAAAILRCDEHGVTAEVTMPAGAWPDALAAAASQEVPAMSFRIPDDDGTISAALGTGEQVPPISFGFTEEDPRGTSA
jgi:hypothetical protein